MGTNAAVSPGERSYQDIEGQSVPTNNQDIRNMF